MAVEVVKGLWASVVDRPDKRSLSLRVTAWDQLKALLNESTLKLMITGDWMT